MSKRQSERVLSKEDSDLFQLITQLTHEQPPNEILNEARGQPRWMEALERLTRIRDSVHRTYGVYLGDLVAESRAERERQLDFVQSRGAQG